MLVIFYNYLEIQKNNKFKKIKNEKCSSVFPSDFICCDSGASPKEVEEGSYKIVSTSATKINRILRGLKKCPEIIFKEGMVTIDGFCYTSSYRKSKGKLGGRYYATYDGLCKRKPCPSNEEDLRSFVLHILDEYLSAVWDQDKELIASQVEIVLTKEKGRKIKSEDGTWMRIVRGGCKEDQLVDYSRDINDHKYHQQQKSSIILSNLVFSVTFLVLFFK